MSAEIFVLRRPGSSNPRSDDAAAPRGPRAALSQLRVAFDEFNESLQARATVLGLVLPPEDHQTPEPRDCVLARRQD